MIQAGDISWIPNQTALVFSETVEDDDLVQK